MGRIILGLGLLLATILSANTALACACCDGDTKIQPKGWSAKGDKVLVKINANAACESSEFLSVLAVGEIAGEHCYDLAGVPNQRIKCSEVSTFDWASKDWPRKKPKKSKITARFRRSANALSPRQVRAMSINGEDGDSSTVTVEVYWKSKWYKMWHGKLGIGTSEADGGAVPHAVRIFPASRGRKALLVIANDYTRGGNGHFGTFLQWIELPRGFRAKRKKASKRSAPLNFSVRSWVKDDNADPELAETENASGQKLYRRKKFAPAIEKFIAALGYDATNVMARYNLARALNQLGLQVRALGQLQQIAAAKCPQCKTNLERAKQDKDLASLRTHRAFRKLTRTASK